MATGTSHEELYEALWLKLSDDATLLGLTGPHPSAASKARVYDEPPTNAAMPYIVLDLPTATPFNTFGVTGREWLVDVHVYSGHKGAQEAGQILARVEALLDHQHAALTVTGYTVARCALEDVNHLRESPLIRHGAARYRVTLQEA